MTNGIKHVLKSSKKILLGRLLLLLFSSIFAISLLLFYTNYIERNTVEKGSISKNFWENIFYNANNRYNLKTGHNINNTRYYMLNPGVSLTFWGNSTLIWPTRVKINEAGFRDYEYQVAKPEGVFRIVILGDSLIFGLGVNMEDTFPKVLEKMLNKEGNKFEVFNAGLPASTPFMQNLFFQHTFAKYNPDMVLWFYSPDDYKCFDITNAYQMSSGPYLRDNAKNISRTWEALKNDSTITDKSLEIHLINFLQSFPADLVPELLKICIKMPLLELQQNIERKGSQLIYFIFEDDPLYAWTIFEYVKKLNVYVVYNQDFINILRKHEISPERDNHLTVEGHKLMGRLLYNYLKGEQIIERKYKQK